MSKPVVLWIITLLLLASAPAALDPFYLGILQKMLIWGLFASGFNLLFGYAGMLSLGHSVYFGLGAYGAALTVLHLNGQVLGPLVVGLTLGALGATAIGWFAVRTGSHAFIIVTAVTSLVFSLLAQSQNSVTGGDDGLPLPPLPLRLGSWEAGCADPGLGYIFVLMAVALSTLLLAWLTGTPVGLALRCIRDNELRASALGYNPLTLKWLAFALSGAICALSGSLYALTSCHLSTGVFHWIVSADAIIWTLFGGAGTLVGPFLGTGFLFWAREALSNVWPNGYPVLVGVLILIIVRFFPGGLAGMARRFRRSR